MLNYKNNVLKYEINSFKHKQQIQLQNQQTPMQNQQVKLKLTLDGVKECVCSNYVIVSCVHRKGGCY